MAASDVATSGPGLFPLEMRRGMGARESYWPAEAISVCMSICLSACLFNTLSFFCLSPHPLRYPRRRACRAARRGRTSATAAQPARPMSFQLPMAESGRAAGVGGRLARGQCFHHHYDIVIVVIIIALPVVMPLSSPIIKTKVYLLPWLLHCRAGRRA